MKTFLLTLLILILVPNTKSVIGTYKIVDEFSDDTLQLNNDGTYIYKVLDDSCWTRSEFSGNWTLEKENLILAESVNTYEDELKIREQFELKDNDSITITLKTEKNKPVNNFTIEYYSFDEKQFQSVTSDEKGILHFKKNDIIENINENSFIDIVGEIGQKNISSRLISSRNADKIFITINLEPKKVIENRIHKFKIMKNSLILLESKALEIEKQYKKL